MNRKDKTILVVDDNAQSLKAVSTALKMSGYHVLSAEDGTEGLKFIENECVNLVVTDLKMSGIDGMDVLRDAKRRDPNIAVIVMTAYGTVESAVEAMKIGAYDYLNKPINLDELRLQVRRALEKQKLIVRVEDLERKLEEHHRFEDLVGISAKMQHIYQLIRQIAPSKSTVVISGESGTGKELIARAIHHNSPRRDASFVPLNCSALPEGLLETELFGHEKGAFTGAIERHKGVFEVADRGTLFLDEIVEMSPSTQVKLLRVLEGMEFTRVGGNERIQTDVRVIAATNTPLERAVAESRLREDLYYRLKVVSIEVPPLRERREDIPLLAKHFLQQFNEENEKNIHDIAQEALDRLTQYDWPGNVRELKNCIENIVVMTNRDSISLEDLPLHIRRAGLRERGLDVKVGMSMEDIEKEAIKETLSHSGGNRTKAAEILGMSVRTLQRKIKRYRIL